MCGDFNRHHHSWSDLAATQQESLGVQPLDDFFWENGLEPAHAPDSNSCPKDGPHQCPIDMVWAPPHIVLETILDSFSSALSTLSDHAQLSWAVTTNLPPPLPRTRRLTNDNYGEWMEIAFPALVKAFKLLTTDSTLLDAKAAAVVQAMETALQPFTTLTRPSKTEVPWWMPSCGDLLKAIDAAPTNRLPWPPSPPPGTPPLLLTELTEALSDTSNLSALGPLGIGYCPLKWVVAAFPEEVLTLFNDCLRLGHHPECWRVAKVIMLWKLNKKDPFSPRSYCPITLKETLGKLLEKMIANRLQFLANTKDWLPPNQYGGRQGHSVYDAAQHLLQLTEGAHATNQVCSILVVDIQGFFDSMHPQLLHQQLLMMGCLPNTADWCLLFMTGCKVTISFDGTTTPLTTKLDLGTPQGSPASPILSTIFVGHPS
ncbi:hypothetical protein M0805_004040 [Coniferiporia weirii]|nr:hypothetical protein M0805_004040 [Coniferiporia weirii]